MKHFHDILRQVLVEKIQSCCRKNRRPGLECRRISRFTHGLALSLEAYILKVAVPGLPTDRKVGNDFGIFGLGRPGLHGESTSFTFFSSSTLNSSAGQKSAARERCHPCVSIVPPNNVAPLPEQKKVVCPDTQLRTLVPDPTMEVA